jgi:hypothetical protein
MVEQVLLKDKPVRYIYGTLAGIEDSELIRFAKELVSKDSIFIDSIEGTEVLWGFPSNQRALFPMRITNRSTSR